MLPEGEDMTQGIRFCCKGAFLQKGGTTLEILMLVVFVIALIVSAMIVNAVQQMFMNFIGADVMFFNGKTKLAIIVILAFLMFRFVAGFFGLTV